MIMPDKKKLSTVIVAKMRGDKPDEMSKAPEVPEDSSIAKESAAEELLAAVEAKDAKAIVAAFESMLELCDSEGYEAEDESEEA